MTVEVINQRSIYPRPLSWRPAPGHSQHGRNPGRWLPFVGQELGTRPSVHRRLSVSHWFHKSGNRDGLNRYCRARGITGEGALPAERAAICSPETTFCCLAPERIHRTPLQSNDHLSRTFVVFPVCSAAREDARLSRALSISQRGPDYIRARGG